MNATEQQPIRAALLPCLGPDVETAIRLAWLNPTVVIVAYAPAQLDHDTALFAIRACLPDRQVIDIDQQDTTGGECR